MNYIFNISYNGKFFYGSQSQLSYNTVHDFFQFVIFKYTRKIYKFIFSSRTDSSVNSLNQILLIFSKNLLKKKIFLLDLNNIFLPKWLRVFSIKQISKWFHSIYSSLNRIYCYIFSYNFNHLCNFFDFIYFVNSKFNLYSFINFIKHIIGVKNFFIFNSSKNFSIYDSVRIFEEFNFYKINNYIYFLFKGNSFLYNMIRNIINYLIFINYFHLNITIFVKYFYTKYFKTWIKPVYPGSLFLIKINYPF